MSTTMSTLTHVRGKRHQRSLALQEEHEVEQNFIEKGSLPTLKTSVSITDSQLNVYVLAS